MTSKAPSGKRAISPRTCFSVAVCLALAAYAAWARGGTVVSLQAPLPVLGGLLVLCLLWPRPASSGVPRRGLVRDPVTWLGLLFLLLLGIQWYNAGRFHFFDPLLEAWGYTPPRIPRMPSAITRADAAEMLRWFFPAWALMLVIRHRIDSSRAARWLLGGLAIQGGILALFGIVQQLSGTTSVFWVTDLAGTRFFASFGYENHAGSYFVLSTAISAGLLLREILRYDRYPHPARLTGWAVLTLVNFLGANLSFSRAGILLAWALAAIAFVYLVYQSRRRWRPSTCINVGLAGLVIIGLGAMGAEQLAKGTIEKELSTLRQFLDPEAAQKPHTSLLYHDRVMMVEAAWNIWQDYPWFGCGGWGYRYLMPYELPEDDWKWSSTGYGKANVHNDLLQFLAEFGVVGTGLMLACVIALAAPALRTPLRNPLAFLCLTGAGLVVVHSLIDLPFRSPGILYAWLIAIGCAAALQRARRVAPPL